jgi:hypothetical protein
MGPHVELRLFRGAISAIALVTLAGLAGGFGGVPGLAAVFGLEAPPAIDPALHNHLRAVVTVFAGFGAIMVWAAFELERGAPVFRIGVVAIVLAGLARATGWIVDGPPGAVPAALLVTELVAFPLLALWHARLLRKAA